MCGGGGGKTPDSEKYRNRNLALHDFSIERMEAAVADLEKYDELNFQTMSQLVGTYIPAMREQFAQSRIDSQRYRDTFAPMEDQYAQEAQGYDTQGRRDEAAGRAGADVAMAIEAQKRNAAANLESYGIDPSQTRYAALDRVYGLERARQTVEASQTARNRVEDTGRQMRENAISLGQGINQQGQRASQTGAALGQATSGAVQTGSNVNAMNTAIPQSWASMAGGFNSQAWNMKLQESQAKQQAAGADAGGLAGIGSAVGTVAGGVIGAYFGGPMGAAAGAQLGGAAGGGAGQAVS